ncbi:MAG: M14 family zinc carboxypeptidase [Solirubrobacteraceae bacterium]|nr:M14 family zinc carboxypeptidase [Solirubrobacteraceae bacterium]
MSRFSFATVSMLATLLVGSAAANAAPQAPSPQRDRFDVYTGVVDADQLDEITALGIDRHEMKVGRAGAANGARLRVETILSGRQARSLRREGIELAPKTVGGQTAAQRATAQIQAGLNVFRPYSGAGGLREEFTQVASQNPKITKLVTYGKTVQGQDIIALKVAKNARTTRDGSRPAVLYLGAQHAREWITPEMIRRLMHHFVDNYAADSTIRRLVDANELWFVPVANPDGYDWTFQEDQRLWRKNLRDNNGDGQITVGDGVDLNRNFATKWGYDNEGSSPDPASDTYRGPSPNSEPETKGLDSLARRVGFEFLVNYHSAAELLLYGTGWQVATPTPDDVIYEAMAGDDANPAVPGYDPDISAELYTTNGDTDTHMTARYRTLGFTPEMSTCEAAVQSRPDDEWDLADCAGLTGFEFPDDEALVQAEFEKNIPFALSVAQSAKDPDDPVSVVGRTAEDFRIDSFDVSYGDPQKVAVIAKRALKAVTMQYRVNGGRTRISSAPEWQGGERYGDENDDYYAERRGTVRGAGPGDEVEVWFTGLNLRRGFVRSERFTYTVQSDTGDDVLVIANEDYTGVNPTYPAGTSAPKYVAQHVAAIEASGRGADVWDVDAQGVPHDLGVLSHYDAIVWYLGDNRITQDPADVLTSTPFGNLPDLSVAEEQQYLTLAVRDFLNEGGKLVHAGETAQYEGRPGISDAVGGLYYGLNGDPTAECVVSSVPGFFEDCLILADDFRQYYLGGYVRTSIEGPTGVRGTDTPLSGFASQFGGPVAEGDNPLDEAGYFQPTSDVLPVAQFPQFASRGVAAYDGGNRPFEPVEGERFAYASHADNAYMRLSKTVDLTTATSAQLQFGLSLSSEEDYDHFIVEAHTVGQDNWTTLAEIGGATSTDRPAECDDPGFLLAIHPNLRHYFSGPGCANAGTSGTWNSITGATDGWQQVAYDLSAFNGGEVEIVLTYVSDPFTGGVGAFVDDTRIVVDGVTDADGFEGTTSSWTPAAPPAGSPDIGANWVIGPRLLNFYAATATRDTLLLGFGFEQLESDAKRAELMSRALNGLLGGGRR